PVLPIVTEPYVPTTGLPTLAPEPCTADTVSVADSPVSGSVSLVSTLPAALPSPAFGVSPGFTPDSTTGSPVLVSAFAVGVSFVPVIAIVSDELECAPNASTTV